MYINPVNSNNNISMQGKKNPNWFTRQIRRIEQKVLDLAPSHTSKESKKSVETWDKTNHWVSDPMWNRGIMGATALLTQPAIDYYNHRVDDETRTVSRNRTIAKIIAGTLVGMFVVRGPIYKLIENMTNVKGKTKFSKALLPIKYIKDLVTNKSALNNYRSALSMAVALLAMVFTNILLDAPLTIFLTNYFNKQSKVGAYKEKQSPNQNYKIGGS